MILSAIVIVILIAIIMLKSGKGQKKIVLPLNELSPIWTRYNEFYDEIEVSDDTMAVDEPSGKNESPETRRESQRGSPRRVATTEKVARAVKTKQVAQSGKKAEKINSDNNQPFLVEPLKSFWDKCIKPYQHVFDSQNVSDVLKELIEILEKHGHCPSVSVGKKDSEAIDLLSVNDNLVQVSLKEHTYAVAQNLVEIIKNSYLEYEDHIPKAVITALAHDIGKIPEYRLSGAYNTYEHHLISGNKLSELFAGRDLFWIRQAVHAVENHHAHTSDDFTLLLKQADRQARQFELIKFTKGYSIIPFEEWFKADALYKSIEPHINYIQSYRKWVAFTLKGVVYCKPDFLYDKAKELCREAKALDLTFIYESEKQNALRKVVSTLRKAEKIPDFLKSNQFTRKFELKTHVGKQRYMLTPLKCSESFNLLELESRKMGYLEIIDRVIPC
ncbi:MAG: hypothetical protein AMK70_04245 [Nitrospira bacterium SG8_35_1]|nr:MAG: hypothetical protein AMK70_04245 [Nitrospira bacterium SG8_35_1]